jgi:hypothetical protein
MAQRGFIDGQCRTPSLASRTSVQSEIWQNEANDNLCFCSAPAPLLADYSKDHRPDLRQLILVIDGDGRPVCSELWPGNTVHVSTSERGRSR